MVELSLAHTAELSRRDLLAIRLLLDESFDEQLAEEDHEHALGGVHALVRSGPTLVGHGSVVMRRLLHRGRALRTGYVEAVAVRPDARGHGHGAAVMTALERVIRQAYDVGALGATDEAAGFYAARGWQPWAGTTSVVTPQGLRRTPDDDGAVYVLPVTADLALHGDLACDWRDGDVW